MSKLLAQSFLSVIQADESSPAPSAAGEILVARVAALVYGLAQRAPEAAVIQAAASGSSAALMKSLAAMVITEAPAEAAWETALLQGQVALAERLEAVGGVWTAEEAMHRLGVKRQSLQQWRDQGRVLALMRQDGSFSYPLAQFKQPASDTGVPRPYGVIQDITATVGTRMSAEELVAMLAEPQAMLADADAQPMTPFAAIAAGEDDRVMEFVRWAVARPDADAPEATSLEAPAPVTVDTV